MADEKSATQLPLFESKFFLRLVDMLPTNWGEASESLGVSEAVDLSGVDLRLAAPYQHREIKLQQDQKVEDLIELLALKSQKHPDDVRTAHAYFTDGKFQPGIFEHFVKAAETAEREGILPEWIEMLKQKAAKPHKQRWAHGP